jgi:hypothetical protein
MEQNQNEIQKLLRPAIKADRADMGLVRVYYSSTDELIVKESVVLLVNALLISKLLNHLILHIVVERLA